MNEIGEERAAPHTRAREKAHGKESVILYFDVCSDRHHNNVH